MLDCFLLIRENFRHEGIEWIPELDGETKGRATYAV